MTITIGGKPIKPLVRDPAPTHVGVHRLLTTDQIAKRHPAEPFPPIDAFRSETVDHRLSVAGDLRLWVEQRLDETAVLAIEADWLRLQLRDPSLEGHRMAQDARKRLQGMETQIAEFASDVAYLEAHSDRIWQSLEPNQREYMATAWVTDIHAERIILNSWTRIAQVGFTWPKNYYVRRQWFRCLADPLIEDMDDAGLKERVALGEQCDPFEAEEVSNE